MLLFMQPSVQLAFWAAKCTLLAHVQFVIHQYPQALLCRDVLYKFVWMSLALMQNVCARAVYVFKDILNFFCNQIPQLLWKKSKLWPVDLHLRAFQISQRTHNSGEIPLPSFTEIHFSQVMFSKHWTCTPTRRRNVYDLLISEKLVT